MSGRGRGRGRGGRGGAGGLGGFAGFQPGGQKEEKFQPPPLYPPVDFSAGFPKIDNSWIALVDRKSEIACMFDLSEHHIGEGNRAPDFNWDLFPSDLRPSEKRKKTVTKKEKKARKEVDGDITKSIDKYTDKDEGQDDTDDSDAEKQKDDGDGSVDGDEPEPEGFEEENDYAKGFDFDDDEEYDEGEGEDNDKE